MKTVENYKPRIRDKCRYCKCYLPKGCINDVCLKCSKAIHAGLMIGVQQTVSGWLKEVYVNP